MYQKGVSCQSNTIFLLVQLSSFFLCVIAATSVSASEFDTIDLLECEVQIYKFYKILCLACILWGVNITDFLNESISFFL